MLLLDTFGCGEVDHLHGVLARDLKTHDALFSVQVGAEQTSMYNPTVLADKASPSHLAASWYHVDTGATGVALYDWEAATQVATIYEEGSYISWHHLSEANGLILTGEASADDDRGEVLVFSPEIRGEVDSSAAVAAHHGSREEGALGEWFVNVNDVDGDGLDDVLLAYGAPWTLLSGEDLVLDEGIQNALRLETWPMYAYSGTPLGDFDGDGRKDIGVGSWVLDEDAGTITGSVRVYLGGEASPYATILDNRPFESGRGFTLGKWLGGIGDPDEDGWPTLVAALEADRQYTENPEYWLVEAPLCGTVELEEVGTRLELGTDEKFGTAFAAGTDTLVLPVFDWNADLVGDAVLTW